MEGEQIYTSFDHFKNYLRPIDHLSFEFYYNNVQFPKDDTFRLLYYILQHPDDFAPTGLKEEFQNKLNSKTKLLT